MNAHPEALASALATTLGSAVRALVGVSGGDINDAFEAELASGERLFVKTHRQAPAGMFAAEAAGLDWLAEAKALRVPKVRAVADEDLGSGAAFRFLALEHIPRGRPGPEFDEALGRGLAALHRAGAPGFGWWRDNFIGTLPQANVAASASTWAAFYRARRLEPLVQRAHAAGTLGASDLHAFDDLYDRLDELVGPAEPPARLHGDLWAGNHLADADGQPVIFDPSVYGGHREVDLALMRLFGGYGPRVFAAYHEAHPLARGHEERVALYQLYPLLVHLNLFGSTYGGQLRAALRAACRI
ncbi:MAG: fructosamine kinase family protein [Myxococcales bacterium]|nr:fructosamine kinase family protein [Myxococcales bacterium]